MRASGTLRGKPAADPEAQEAAERCAVLVKTTRIIWSVACIIEVMIGMRILLTLVGTSPDAGFSQFVYGMTQVYLVPFLSLVASLPVHGAILEIASLIALLSYGLLAWVIVKAVWLTSDR
jgi:hypothetical protein